MRARRAGWPALRVTGRLAWRSVARSRGSSALVVLLVALPVAGLAGAAIFGESHRATPEQAATLQLGRAQSWIESTGIRPAPEQAVDDPRYSRGFAGRPPAEALAPPTGPPAMIPAGSAPLTLTETTAVIDTAGGRGRVDVTVGDAWDPLVEGRYVPIAGETPHGPAEAMVSPGLLTRLGAGIGDTVTLSESGATFTITGTLRRADQQESEERLFLPNGAASLPEPTGASARWYLADWQPTATQLRELNDAGYVAYAHDLATAPPPGAFVSGGDASAQWSMLVIGAVVAVFSGYLVVLLAGAALAVSARRQQRALAVASSVGAARRDVFRVVLLQGAFLGALGAAGGLLLGAGGAAIALAATDRGAVSTFWGNWGFRLPAALIAAIAVFALLIGTLAAVAPARSATRGDPLWALRGARRPARLNARRPVGGLVLVLGSVGLTVASGLTIAAMVPQGPSETIEPLRIAALIALVLGPVVFQVGVILAGHWIFVVLSRPIARLGHGARLASRDAAAAPSRVVPAFAAIAATVFAASFVLSVIALNAASAVRAYAYSAPEQSLLARVVAGEESSQDTLLASAHALLEGTEPAPAGMAVLGSPRPPLYDRTTHEPVDPDASEFFVARNHDPRCPSCAWQEDRGAQLTIVAPEDLETVLGVSLRPETLAAYRGGAAVAASPDLVHDGMITVTRFRAADEARPGTDTPPAAEQRILLPAIELDRRMVWGAIVAPATADGLGIATAPATIVARYDALPPQAELDRLTAETERRNGGDVSVSRIFVASERGPATGDPWLAAVLAVTTVLVVGASAISLGLSRFERRPDDATLAAVGAGRLLRRGVNAWQALLIAGIGTIVGTVAGQIPVWGLSRSIATFDLGDTPLLWLALLALVLPALIAAISWLVPPRRADVTRRTAIT
ncbi:FtsX-like permease family protein [Microbacterium sp. X-17]|uniref:FtsX-like permease family protein n=1 Tax=Microbacterium sp. X-17 TaxID=3144404 RepID=UPI0031F5614B